MARNSLTIFPTVAESPDVILMDLRMPQKDGIETTKVVAKLYPPYTYYRAYHVRG
jgi:DNA-binding NarL/FixJ family response regulator